MKKYLSLFLALIICFSSLTTTFASEVENGEVNNSSGMVDDPDILSDLENGEDNGGESTPETGEGDSSSEPSGDDGTLELEPIPEEPSEEPTEPSEGSEMTNQNITVDVSENSIQAIADAVTTTETTYEQQYSYLYALPPEYLQYGKPVYIDTDIPNFLTDYRVVSGWTNGGYNLTYFDSSYSGSFRSSTGEYLGISTVVGTSYSCEQFDDIIVYVLDSEHVSKKTSWSMASLYTNFHVYNSSGELLFESPYIPPETFDISFNTGFEDLVLDSQNSSSFTLPVPSYEGYQFGGWYLDNEFLTPYTSDYVFSQDTTLYAKWTPYVTISFVTNIEDYTLDSIKVLAGTSYTPSDFAYAGHTYYGAYTDADFLNQFVSGTEITTDVTLYLRFEPVVYDVGELLTRQVELSEGLQVMQGQLWIILIVGLLYFVYRFFRIFF